MGVFNFFLDEDKKKQPSKKAVKEEGFNFNNQNGNGASSMDVFFPKSYDDVSAIINVLSLGKPAVVNIKGLSESVAQRVIDLLSGAIYALKGGLCQLDQGLYLFSTNGVTVK